jgi:hypothetical protein
MSKILSLNTTANAENMLAKLQTVVACKKIAGLLRRRGSAIGKCKLQCIIFCTQEENLVKSKTIFAWIAALTLAIAANPHEASAQLDVSSQTRFLSATASGSLGTPEDSISDTNTNPGFYNNSVPAVKDDTVLPDRGYSLHV